MRNLHMLVPEIPARNLPHTRSACDGADNVRTPHSTRRSRSSGVSRQLQFIVSLLGLLTAMYHTSLGQTEWKDPGVTMAKEDQSVPSIARPTQVGYTIVVWEDARDVNRGPDIYIQKIDDETGLPMWIDPDGIHSRSTACLRFDI